MTASVELKVAIVRSGLHQYDLAARVGISETRLSRIVRGRLDPTADERQRLAAVLRTSEDRLFIPDVILDPPDGTDDSVESVSAVKREQK